MIHAKDTRGNLLYHKDGRPMTIDDVREAYQGQEKQWKCGDCRTVIKMNYVEKCGNCGSKKVHLIKGELS